MVVQNFASEEVMGRLRNIPETPNHIPWPNVIVNAHSTNHEKESQDSSLSIITNIKGSSEVLVNKRLIRVCAATFLIINPHQSLFYKIEQEHAVETCNVHFNYAFAQEALNALRLSDEVLLHNPQAQHAGSFSFLNQLHYKSQDFQYLLNPCNNVGEETYVALIEKLVHNEQLCLSHTRRIQCVKVQVRHELYRRISIAKDYIYGCYDRPWVMDELSREVGMSKYHFLRVFKDYFGYSAYYLLKQVRLSRAKDMLVNTNLGMNDIAYKVGFEEANSFFKSFKQAYKVTPLCYRMQNSNFG